MQAKDMKLTISDPSILEGYQPGSRKKTFWIGLAIIAAVAIAAIVWVAWGLKAREAEFEANLQKRLDLMAASQVQVMNALVETSVEQANRVINSELYKLYAAEVHLIEDDVALLVSGPLPGQQGVNGDIAQLSASFHCY
jgi:aspartate ammonia-lyase